MKIKKGVQPTFLFAKKNIEKKNSVRLNKTDKKKEVTMRRLEEIKYIKKGVRRNAKGRPEIKMRLVNKQTRWCKQRCTSKP